VLQEVHQSCPHRERTGSCKVCMGTPVAEELPSPSVPKSDPVIG
jgi:hypothetical protein